MHDEGTLINTVVPTLKRDEGLRLKAYQDTEGVWTIGYGLNLQTLEITEAEADQWLMRKLSRAINDARSIPEFHELSTVRKGVIVSMIYQMGLRGVLNFKRMWAAIREKDWVAAAGEMKDSTWYRQTPNRTHAMAERMRTDNWEA